MPLDPRAYLKITDDAFTRVVDTDGTLLGCVPTSWGEGVEQIIDQDGKRHDMMYGLIGAVVIDLVAGEDPRRLHDFTPAEGLDDTIRKKLLPPEEVSGSDPDIGRP